MISWLICNQNSMKNILLALSICISVCTIGVQTVNAMERSDWTWPTTSEVVSQAYNDQHKAIDIDGETGDPVFAAAAGKVVKSRCSQKHGCYVVVQHGTLWRTRYESLDTKTVKKGAHVEAGDTIGTVGSTAESTGDLLHFAMKLRVDSSPKWQPVNPVEVFFRK